MNGDDDTLRIPPSVLLEVAQDCEESAQELQTKYVDLLRKFREMYPTWWGRAPGEYTKKMHLRVVNFRRAVARIRVLAAGLRQLAAHGSALDKEASQIGQGG